MNFSYHENASKSNSHLLDVFTPDLCFKFMCKKLASQNSDSYFDIFFSFLLIFNLNCSLLRALPLIFSDLINDLWDLGIKFKVPFL